jgi:hypothetical protein
MDNQWLQPSIQPFNLLNCSVSVPFSSSYHMHPQFTPVCSCPCCLLFFYWTELVSSVLFFTWGHQEKCQLLSWMQDLFTKIRQICQDVRNIMGRRKQHSITSQQLCYQDNHNKRQEYRSDTCDEDYVPTEYSRTSAADNGNTNNCSIPTHRELCPLSGL